ncbi:hypothetical protein FACS1894171_1210 [Clostridia bacterium]|nr:hypothetical protein FACS1894171_1210 [Clostridia bacterium]
MVDDAIAADEAGQGVYTTSQPETTVGELPAAVAAKVNTSAVVSDYAGSYTGTAVLTMDNAELLLSVGMVPPGDAAALKAMLGKPFPATAEVDEDYDRVEISAPLPAPFDSDLGETFYLDDDMVNVNGVWTNTEDQSGEQDGVTMAMRGVQKIALLSDGGIYILISAEMNIGGEMGVMELRFELTR